MEQIQQLLWEDYGKNRWFDKPCSSCGPTVEAVRPWLRQMQMLLFPGYFGCRESGSLFGMVLARAGYGLEQLTAAGQPWDTRTFFRCLPRIRELLEADLQAFLASDPAAAGAEEILACYPGFYAITVQRLAHALYAMQVPLLPRMMTEIAHSATGIDIHPGAVLGPSFFIDHGTGVVIGETTVIGTGVKLYQGVTLGALSTRNAPALRGIKRHPTLEDGVTVYAGASILGGDTRIGAGAVIGANAFVTGSVEPGVTVIGHRPGP